MPIRPILLQQEAKQFSGLGDSYPSCDMADILTVEQYEMRHCFGNAFYRKLRASLANYSGAVKYASGTYQEGDIVIYRDKLYKALADTTREPVDVNYWAAVTKFDTDTECGAVYEELWCTYLARYIALKVWKHTMALNMTDTSAVGEVVKISDNYAPAPDKRVNIKIGAIDSILMQLYENMDYFMRENNQDGCFDTYKGIAKDCCKTCFELACDCTCENCLDAHIRIGSYFTSSGYANRRNGAGMGA